MKDSVYDVGGFLDDHPGGPDILLEQGGNEVTTLFENVGHSEAARSLLPKLKIGCVATTKGTPPEPAKGDHSTLLSDDERRRILEEGRREMNRWTFAHTFLPIIIAAIAGLSTYCIVAKIRHPK